jgi:hypothetical protein
MNTGGRGVHGGGKWLLHFLGWRNRDGIHSARSSTSAHAIHPSIDVTQRINCASNEQPRRKNNQQNSETKTKTNKKEKQTEIRGRQWRQSLPCAARRIATTSADGAPTAPAPELDNAEDEADEEAEEEADGAVDEARTNEKTELDVPDLAAIAANRARLAAGPSSSTKRDLGERPRRPRPPCAGRVAAACACAARVACVCASLYNAGRGAGSTAWKAAPTGTAEVLLDPAVPVAAAEEEAEAEPARS